MNAPTIDELIVWLNEADFNGREAEREAIRTILVLHRDNPPQIGEGLTQEFLQKQQALQTIRAFVERVEQRQPAYRTGRAADTWLKAYRQQVLDELKAMEKENE